MSYRGDDRGRRDRPDHRGQQGHRGGYAGHKRGREQERPPPDPKKELIERLLRVGEPQVRVAARRAAPHLALCAALRLRRAPGWLSKPVA